jgi:transcriptional regulator GlxA family with amidase domain
MTPKRIGLVGFDDFVENLRLNEARRRLSKRQKTVQSVATSVGFTNAAVFQRAFARRFGSRPGRYLGDALQAGVIPHKD